MLQIRVLMQDELGVTHDPDEGAPITTLIIDNHLSEQMAGDINLNRLHAYMTEGISGNLLKPTPEVAEELDKIVNAVRAGGQYQGPAPDPEPAIEPELESTPEPEPEPEPEEPKEPAVEPEEPEEPEPEPEKVEPPAEEKKPTDELKVPALPPPAKKKKRKKK